MVLSQAERARIVVKWYAQKEGIPMSKVGETLGYTNASAFSQVLNGKKKIPESLLPRLASLDPNINPDFILGNSNDMLINGDDRDTFNGEDDKPRVASGGVFLPAELVSMFRDLSATVRSQQETISLLVKAAVGEAAPKKDAM